MYEEQQAEVLRQEFGEEELDLLSEIIFPPTDGSLLDPVFEPIPDQSQDEGLFLPDDDPQVQALRELGEIAFVLQREAEALLARAEHPLSFFNRSQADADVNRAVDLLGVLSQLREQSAVLGLENIAIHGSNIGEPGIDEIWLSEGIGLEGAINAAFVRTQGRPGVHATHDELLVLPAVQILARALTASGLLALRQLAPRAVARISSGTAARTATSPALPAFVRGGKTTGVLRVKSGEITLISGRAGPAASLPKPSPGFNAITSTHVEGHSAALMRQQGIRDATLYINNPAICRPCLQNLEHMLPSGSKLHIVLPDGTIRTFVGNVR